MDFILKLPNHIVTGCFIRIETLDNQCLESYMYLRYVNKFNSFHNIDLSLNFHHSGINR